MFLQTPASYTPFRPHGNLGGQQILGSSHPPRRPKSGGPTQQSRCHPRPLPHTCSRCVPLRGGALEEIRGQRAAGNRVVGKISTAAVALNVVGASTQLGS
jgi:hypothetical protein